jgi:hypothetical protein
MAITINIKNKKALSILKSLEDINFIEVKNQDDLVIDREKEVSSRNKNDFFQLHGLWKDRDINADTIREKAWKRK